MTQPEFQFLFERAGRSPNEGAVDPAEEHFRGSTAAAAAVRETGQNSLDARRQDHEGPVRMEFELATVATSEIPDIEGLRRHLRRVVEATSKQMGHDRMCEALEMAERESIPVLRISDYGTTGLTGGEQERSSDSALSRLTRGSGDSANDGVRGGSFGIGSAAGRVASAMATVLYRSLPHDQERTVFAGFSRLASHYDDEGVRRRAGGIFTRIARQADFEYLRPAPGILPFAERTEPGTDIFVLGYRLAEEDPLLHGVRGAAIENFLVAIDRGRLEITGIAAGQRWTLDSGTVGDQARRHETMAAFHAALRDPEPSVRELPELGRVELFVNIDDRLPRTLHTMTMRKPLMRIGEFRFNTVRAKYAAILICADESGNTLLRELEPPQHDKWDPARSPAKGRAAIESLRSFVRDELRKRVSENLGETIRIDGLERFLPAVGIGSPRDGEDGRPDGVEPPVPDESARVTGSSDPIEVRPARGRTVPVTVVRPAVGGDGGVDIDRGKVRGGTGRRRDGRRGQRGTGGDGDGRSRIHAGNVEFRSWNAGIGDEGQRTVLVLKPREDVTGDLELAAVGPGGEVDRGHDLKLRAVRAVDGDRMRPLRHSGNVIEGLELAAGATVRIEVLTPPNLRYRLGVA